MLTHRTGNADIDIPRALWFAAEQLERIAEAQEVIAKELKARHSPTQQSPESSLTENRPPAER